MLLSLSGTGQSTAKHTISGYVKEFGSLEPLLGVNIYVPALETGTTTNTYGFYSITLPEQSDTISIYFSYVGFESKEAEVLLTKSYDLNIQLKSRSDLKEVVVEGKKELTPAEIPQMSRIEIPVHTVRNLPALLGEKDVLKVIQLLPGVQSGGEGQSGVYVRGGGPDQNLIILDDATVYNAQHLFGFFSLFNGDAIRSIELIKGGFPAKYGGRLSSVIDINMKEGNKEKFHGEGGVGIISSRLTLEGPIQKGKSSFLFSGRRTYMDLLIRPFMPADLTAGYFFYDFTAKVNFDIDERNKLYVSSYAGRDKFYFNESYDRDYEFNSKMHWGNFTSTARWNHQFNRKVFANTSLIFSQYQLLIGAEAKESGSDFSLSMTSGIRDYSAKFDVDYLPNTRHSIRTGAQITYHTFTPNAVVVTVNSKNELEEIERYQSFENGIYIQDDIRITSRWRALLGLRLSNFMAEEVNLIRPEPRISTSYMIKKDLSVKASYAVMNQYVHLLTNTGIGLPTDLWVPATQRVAPQQSQQVAAGISKDLEKLGWPKLNFSIEGYYKWSNNVISYKEGASFLALDDPTTGTEVSWEDNVTSGDAESYGVEFLVEKKFGKFTGWMGYTLSWTWFQFAELNNGNRFHPRYDRRHDISLVGVYELSKDITISGTWIYGTGNAVTLPLAGYTATGLPSGANSTPNAIYAQHYGEKNAFRMAAYHRFDLGVQFHKDKGKYERTWEVSVYNLYNQKNPFFYYIAYEQGRNRLKQVTLFPLIPSVSYSFKF